jgi:hypothetical protein
LRFRFEGSNQSLRKQDYDTLIFNLEEERKSLGDEQFPPQIQNAIDCYDLKTQYIPQDEIDGVLASFNQYINSPHNMNMENISIHAEELLCKHWGILYNKHIIGFGGNISENETSLCTYFDALKDLRESLLGTMSIPDNLRLYYKAANTIKKIQDNPTYLNDKKAFHKTITDISYHINNKINSLENYQYLVGYVGLSTLTLSYLLATEDSLGKAILLGLLVPGLTILGTKYVAKPISDFISCTFFHKNNSAKKGFSAYPAQTDNELLSPSNPIIDNSHSSTQF